MKKKIKIILLQDIKKLGKKHEIKELPSGYAYYLYENNQIDFYNPNAWQKVEKEKVIEKEKQSTALVQAQNLQRNLDKHKLTFTLPKNQKGEVLGSVGFQEISSELKKSDIILAKKHFPSDFHPLSKVGENTVLIKLGSGLVARLKIIIK